MFDDAHTFVSAIVSKTNSVRSIKVNKAFTLAEVLITLGIIGVVAAMTIPTLLVNYQKKATVSRLQKVNSILSNMTMMLYADGGYNVLTGNVSADKTEEYFNNYVLKYFKSPFVYLDKECVYPSADGNCFIYKYLDGSTSVFDMSIITRYDSGRVAFTTNDGILYFFNNMKWVNNGDGSGESHAVYTSSPAVYVDLNGVVEPNTFGKDVFRFSLDFVKGVVKTQCADYTTEEVNDDCSSSGKGFCCAEKIRRDGWRITDDYPF